MNQAPMQTVVTPTPGLVGHFKLYSLVQTKEGLAAIVFFTTILISITLQPPFLLVTSDDQFKEPQFSYPRALFISAAASYVLLRLPSVCRAAVI